MVIELRMHRHPTIQPDGQPFFIQDAPSIARVTSLVLPRAQWEELGRPDELIIIAEDTHRDDRTDTAEIPVITGESEVVKVGDPVPGTRQSFYGALDPAFGRPRVRG